jgi:hypothetical protein
MVGVWGLIGVYFFWAKHYWGKEVNKVKVIPNFDQEMEAFHQHR